MAKKDFFISYAREDEAWAKWIGWQIRHFLGRETFVDAYEILPGDNRVLAIQHALESSERILVVLSRNFGSESITANAWSSAFVDDPDSAKRLLVPIRVDDVIPRGLFRPLDYIDLHNFDAQTALDRLRDGLLRVRGIPEAPPPYPPDSRPPTYPGPLAATDDAGSPQVSPDTRVETPRPGNKAETVIKPEVLAAMLDKERQADHVLTHVPKKRRIRNGGLFGFLLGGYIEEWPYAAVAKTAYKLTQEHHLDKVVYIEHLVGEFESGCDAEDSLYQLIDKVHRCGTTPKRIARFLANRSRETGMPTLFYKDLTEAEATDAKRLMKILAAWAGLEKYLPEYSPSHYLFLINEFPHRSENKGKRTWVTRLFGLSSKAPHAAWLKILERSLARNSSQAQLLPELESPTRRHVNDWAKNHLAPHVDTIRQATVSKKLIEGFGDAEAMPHGELKDKVIDILKTHLP